MGDLLAYTLALIHDYNACAARHAALVRVVAP